MISTTPATTTTLMDMQLVLLSEAAHHSERAVTIPKRLGGGALARVVGPLLAKGSVEAVPHRGEMPVYKTEADGSRRALVITDAGFLALGIELLDAPAAQEAPTEQPVPARKKDAAAGKRATPSNPVRQPRPGIKQELLIAMLRRPEGTTVPEVVAAMGWLPHTVRGAIAGALKKKLDLQIRSDQVKGREHVYNVKE
jgi:uncharacterized protein DUF3489